MGGNRSQIFRRERPRVRMRAACVTGAPLLMYVTVAARHGPGSPTSALICLRLVVSVSSNGVCDSQNFDDVYLSFLVVSWAEALVTAAETARARPSRASGREGRMAIAYVTAVSSASLPAAPSR